MRAILIDDEPLALEVLERQINKVGNIEVVGTFTNFDPAENYKVLENIDIIFLDIEMPEINGLELAEIFLELQSSLSIVFVTAFNDYAVEAFELNALDYLLKPVTLERLEKTIDRIKETQIQRSEASLKLEDELRVNVSRELKFALGENQYEVVQWRTAKAQELFLYLLQHREKTIRKSILAELLWAEFDQERAYSQLYTAIYHIRQTLSKFGDRFLIKNGQEGYILFISNVSIDLVTWEESIRSTPDINRQTIAQFEKNMSLYTGGYLAEYDYMWAEPERFRLEQLWIQTALKMADFYYESKELEKAAEWYAKIAEFQPENEKSHFSLMKIYAELNYGLLVSHQYTQLKNDLQELDIAISPHVKSWYENWSENKQSS